MSVIPQMVYILESVHNMHSVMNYQATNVQSVKQE